MAEQLGGNCDDSKHVIPVELLFIIEALSTHEVTKATVRHSIRAAQSTAAFISPYLRPVEGNTLNCPIAGHTNVDHTPSVGVEKGTNVVLQVLGM